MTEKNRRYAYFALSAVLLIFAIFNWLTTVHELQRFYTNFPIWDAFDCVAHYARYRQFDWSVLWIQHNEHREIGTELLFAIDMLLFGGKQILPTAAGVITYVGVVCIFACFGFWDCKDKLSAVCGALMIATLAGYKLCAVSLTIPFLTSWPQWEFFGVAALASAVLHSKRGGTGMFVLCIFCAVASTYSMSNGMLVWPLLLAAAVLLRFANWQLAVIAASGGASVLAYFYRYTNMHSLALGTALRHPLYLAGFVGSFLGMPFSAVEGMSNPWRANIFGWLALTIAIADAVWVFRKRLWATPPVVVMGGYGLLALASTLLTAAGRMNPDDPYFQAARAGRYITEPILFWCALIALSVWILRSAWRGYAAFAFVLAISVLCAKNLPRTKAYYSWWGNYFARGQWATIAAANGALDDDTASVLYPNPSFVKQYTPVLAQNGLAVFADAEPRWLGQRWSDLFTRGADGHFHGSVTTVKKRGMNYEVQGWVSGSSTVLFTDDAGRILGFGLRPTAGIAEVYTTDVPPGMEFAGFIRGPLFGSHFQVWALDSRERNIFRMGQREQELP